jgi:hypothetical protein
MLAQKHSVEVAREVRSREATEEGLSRRATRRVLLTQRHG